jgi:hypothetical protein
LIELYNGDNSRPAALQGLTIAAGQSLHRIAAPTFVPPRGCIRFWADERPGSAHLGFKLSAAGQTLVLSDANGTEIDRVAYGPQAEGASQGRWPDGNGLIVDFPQTPSPGHANYLPIRDVHINEILARALPHFQPAIELQNDGQTPADLGGWCLSDDQDRPAKYRFPPGTTLDPGALLVVYRAQFNASTDPATHLHLDGARGGAVVLARADAAGNLTGHRDVARFGPTPAPNVSFGRFCTSIATDAAPSGPGVEFVALTRPTFGVDSPHDSAAFQRGPGAPNAPPRIGPVVIGEIHCAPAADLVPTGLDPGWDEFVELLNLAAAATPLSEAALAGLPWRLRGGAEFEFPHNAQIPADARAVLVRFDPAADPAAAAEFRARYGVGATVPLFGPLRGRLDADVDTLSLEQPILVDAPTSGAAQTDAAGAIYGLVDRVAYRTQPPWPTLANGSGWSLHRVPDNGCGIDPGHWQAGPPSPGSPAPRDPASDADQDGDGLPDRWELLHGLDPRSPADAGLDPDHDGLSNRQEYQAGTRPHDRRSTARFDRIAHSPQDGLRLEFELPENRQGILQCRDSIPAGAWRTLAEFAPRPSPETIVFTDTAARTTRLYRLRVAPVPAR